MTENYDLNCWLALGICVFVCLCCVAGIAMVCFRVGRDRGFQDGRRTGAHERHEWWLHELTSRGVSLGQKPQKPREDAR